VPLHAPGCGCNACQDEGMGFPAFEQPESFPTPEHWNRAPMKAPRWGLSSPWSTDEWSSGMGGPIEAIARERAGLSGDFYFDPSTFGDPAFVPGTVPPPAPLTAWESVTAGPIFAPKGLPQNADQALKVLNASGQSPDQNGIAPTLSIQEAQAQAAQNGLKLNSDGSYSPASQGIPLKWVVGGLLLLALLK
jgi:hypothetical protein